MTKAAKPKPGHPPLHRIPIVDHRGNMRGHVGKTATAATVARFLGRHGATLGEHEGRKAWIGDTPPPPKYPGITSSGKAIPGIQPDGSPTPLPGMGLDGKPLVDPKAEAKAKEAKEKPAKPTKHSLEIYFKSKK